MFFPQRITGIKPTDRVLDIGPGADPHPRADVLLEMAFGDANEYANQFGHNRKLVTDKPVIFYDGITFPFADKEFDYVICSHVLEHVPDVQRFLSEMFRVGNRGYCEYPLAYYDLVYNINAHLNFLKFSEGRLLHMKKAASQLDTFKPLHVLLFKTMAMGHTKLLEDLPHLFFEGVQWEEPFAAVQVDRIELLCHTDLAIPVRPEVPLDSYGAKRLLQALGTILKRRAGLR